MENQEIVSDVVEPVVDVVVDAVVDSAPVQDEKTTPPDENTEVQQDEKTQAEKTFTQAELDEILEKKTAKLARQRDKERTQREAAERELQQFKPAYQPTGEPQESQFESAKEYAKAYAQWELGELKKYHQAETTQKAELAFRDRVTEFREELEDHPDLSFDKLSRLPLSDAAVEALLDSDMRVKVASHLLTNKEDVERIAKLSPARQASELGKLEARLSVAPQKKISKAPEPISPVGGKGSVVTADIYDPKFQQNTDAWIAERNKQEAARRKR